MISGCDQACLARPTGRVLAKVGKLSRLAIRKVLIYYLHRRAPVSLERDMCYRETVQTFNNGIGNTIISRFLVKFYLATLNNVH